MLSSFISRNVQTSWKSNCTPYARMQPPCANWTVLTCILGHTTKHPDPVNQSAAWRSSLEKPYQDQHVALPGTAHDGCFEPQKDVQSNVMRCALAHLASAVPGLLAQSVGALSKLCQIYVGGYDSCFDAQQICTKQRHEMRTRRSGGYIPKEHITKWHKGSAWTSCTVCPSFVKIYRQLR